GALLDDALRARPVAEEMLDRVDLVGAEARLPPVEAARAVGARRHAAATADAPVGVDRHDAVGLLPGRLDRARLDAGRVLALLAGDGEVELVRARLVLLVVGVAVLEVDGLRA